jgi:hypothetical protein
MKLGGVTSIQLHTTTATTTESDQAKPVARAAFFATRLRPAPVFRTALFADFTAFAVLDFLRFAIFVPPDSRFVQLGSFLHLCQARFGLFAAARLHSTAGRADVYSQFGRPHLAASYFGLPPLAVHPPFVRAGR